MKSKELTYQMGSADNALTIGGEQWALTILY